MLCSKFHLSWLESPDRGAGSKLTPGHEQIVTDDNDRE